MLLQVSARVADRRPRLWSLATVGGLLALAVLLVGPRLMAEAAPDADPPKKEEPKKAEPKPDLPPPLLPQLPGLDPNQFKAPGLRLEIAPGGIRFDPFGRQGDGRLGVLVQKPGTTLAEQLDLPKGQGLAVEEVHADSAAAKAGLKAHDILLELNGKPVPDDVYEFARMVRDIKAKTPVDAVVLRRGKKETVKGLSLPEAKPQPELPGVLTVPNLPPAVFPPPAVPFPPGGLGGLFTGNGVMTTTFRSNDRFTTRHQEGSLVITVTGTVTDGTAKLGEINVQDGTESHKYESVDKVPERYKDKVKSLIEMSAKGAVKVEIKKP